MIKDAWWLVLKELRFQRFTILFTFLSTAFFAMLAAYYFKEAIIASKDEFILHYILDIVFLLIMPNFVTLYTAGYYVDFRTMKEEPLRKQLLFYRTCPISLGTLTLSRSFKTLTLFFSQSLLFYAIFLILLSSMDPSILTLKLCLFLMFWLGCSLAIGSLIPYIEYGRSVKTIYKVYLLWILLFLILRPVITLIFDKGIAELVWTVIPKTGFPLATASLIIGCLSFYLWNRRLYQRFQTRDYL